MEATSSLARIESAENTKFGIDTTFVLFFLAIDLGQSPSFFALDSIFMAITLLAVAVFPYFANAEEKPEFSNWLLGRMLIVGFALLLGAMFKQTLGVVLPETFRFLPFTLLIVTSMIYCYLQFYNFLRFRLSK